MPRKTTNIAFNPDTMTVSDLKRCAKTLSAILQEFDRHCNEETNYDWDSEGAEAIALTVLKIRKEYEVD